MEKPTPKQHPIKPLSAQPILICTIGLPYSGKSRWAKTQGLPVVSLMANEQLLKTAQGTVPKQTKQSKQALEKESEAEAALHFTRQMIESLFLSGNRVVILLAENLTKRDREFWQSKGANSPSLAWQTIYKEFKSTEVQSVRAATQAGASKALIDEIKTKASLYEPLPT